MPLTPFARALWKPVGAPFIPALLEDQLYEGETVFASNSFEGRRMQVVWEWVNASPVESDICVTTHDFVNITDDETDNTWDGDDFGAVEDAFSTMLASLNSKLDDGCTCVEQRWYKFGPEIQPTQENPQAPVRVHTVNDPGGSGSAALPHQCAIAITEATPVRKRWGRFYMPGFTNVVCANTGNISSTHLDEIADAVHAFYDTCYDEELIPVVWSPTVRRAYAVTELRIDSTIDVIRSRRPTSPALREIRNTAI